MQTSNLPYVGVHPYIVPPHFGGKAWLVSTPGEGPFIATADQIIQLHQSGRPLTGHATSVHVNEAWAVYQLEGMGYRQLNNGEKACCGSCALGKTCDSEHDHDHQSKLPQAPMRSLKREVPARPTMLFGRSQPIQEIAKVDESIEGLRSDVRSYSPPDGDLRDATNWSAITHKLNGFVLRWGQFKRDMASDYWWGDDDEVRFAGLKQEYNTLRQQVLDYTNIRVTPPPVVVAPPEIAPPKPEDELTSRDAIGYGLRAIGLVTAAVVAWKVAPIVGPLLAARFAARSA